MLNPRKPLSELPAADAKDGDRASAVTAPDSYENYRARSFFCSLDGLRCLSVIAVIWVHTGIRVEGWTLTNQGHFGVDMFFAISGFLITTLLLRERDRWGDISLKAFYVRRSLRIFPLYYAVILVYMAVVWLLESDSAVGRDFFANLPYFMTYTSNWFVPLEGRVIFYFAWSLATEEQFYLVWPAVEKFLPSGRALRVAVALLLFRLFIGTGVVSGWLSDDSLGMRMVMSIHPAILGGVILAHLLHDRRAFGFFRAWLGFVWTAPLVLAGLLAALEVGLQREGIWALMVLLVGSVVIRESNGLSPLLKWRPIAHMGMVSYGMYLLHMLSFNAVKQLFQASGLGQQWLWFPATVLVAAVGATLSYRYYESWFLRLKEAYVRVGSRHRTGMSADAEPHVQNPGPGNRNEVPLTMTSTKK